jgi:uncharacterized lipoprotein YmbA
MILLTRLALTVLLIQALAGCGSTPQSRYYVLSAREAGTVTGTSPAIGIGPVSVSEYLRRDNLVVNRDGNALQIAPYQRWAEPIGEGIVRVLALNLAGLLDTQDVQTFPWHREQQPDYAVKVVVLELEADERLAHLVTEWSVRRTSDGQSVARRLSRLEQPIPPGPQRGDALAAAYSDLLHQLSELLADALRQADQDSAT